MLRVPNPRWLMQEVHSNARVYPGSGHVAVRPAGVCECTVLSCTGVPVVGEYKRGERGREAPMSLLGEKMIEASANIPLKRACVCAAG